MKYLSIETSFDHKRRPRLCSKGHIYEFDADPGKHFKPLDEPKVQEPKSPKAVGPDKTELIKEAEARGIDIDKRWKAEKIAEAIESHGDE